VGERRKYIVRKYDTNIPRQVVNRFSSMKMKLAINTGTESFNTNYSRYRRTAKTLSN